MSDKNEKKEPDDSDVEIEKKSSVNTSKISTSVNPKKYLFKEYHPKILFSNEDKNISYYESDSNNSYGEKKYRSLNKILRNRNNNLNLIFRKNTLPQTNYVQENFTYNFINTEENSDNQKSNDSFHHKIFLNNYLIQSCYEVPRRTIKPQQTEYDVEKSDNFNVISTMSKTNDLKSHKKGGGKIIRVLQKEDTDGFFYPSKRAQPRLSPLPINNSEEKDRLLSYKAPTLKIQRLFGTHTEVVNDDEKKESNKTLSKRKRIQLEDYNIEKLIEIGENSSNKYKNLLSFGRKINSIKNKNQNNNSNNNNNNKNLNNKTFDIILNKLSIKKRYNITGNKKRCINIKKKKNEEDINNIINRNEDKKLIVNKINKNAKKYHNFKNAQTFENIYEDINNNNADENDNKNKNENAHERQKIKKHLNQDITDDNNIKVEIQDFIGKSNIRGRNHCYKKKKDKEYTLINEAATTRRFIVKKEEDANSNDCKKNFAIKNFKHISNYIKKKGFSNTIMSKENTARNELKPKLLVSEDKNIIYKSNKNIMQKNKISLQKLQRNFNENKLNQKKNTNCLNIKKNIPKLKNYYGYDERHPLEGSINNHTTFVSIYSRKIINHNNHSIEKQNNN